VLVPAPPEALGEGERVPRPVEVHANQLLRGGVTDADRGQQ
jgi:hypothetical protein